MKITTICIRKGGCGKTATSINLAAGLASLGRKTLVLDFDPQCNATLDTGFDPSAIKDNINAVLTQGTDINKCIIPTSQGYYLIPSHKNLEQTKFGFTLNMNNILALQLSNIKGFDHIIIDTGPATDALLINSLVASTHTIITMKTHYLSLEMVSDTIEVIKNIQKSMNTKLELIGILPTMYDARTNISKIILEEAVALYPSQVLPMVIKYATIVPEGSYLKNPAILREDKSGVSTGYKNLIEYLVTKHGY